MTPDEFECLKSRLYHESITITQKFGQTFNSFFQSLSDRSVPIKKLVAGLKAYGAFSPLHENENQPLLRDELQSIELATADIDDIKLIVLDYCSFFNFRLLSELVTQLGTPNDKELFEQYGRDFTVYAQRRVFECPSEFGELNQTKTDVVVKLDHHYNQCIVDQLRLLQIDLCEIFNITYLKLCRVTSGCLQLIFQIPPFVHVKVFPLTRKQEDRLMNLHVQRVICGDYHFTREVGTNRCYLLHRATIRGIDNYAYMYFQIMMSTMSVINETKSAGFLMYQPMVLDPAVHPILLFRCEGLFTGIPCIP